jgi:hypothetical protein
MRPQVELPLGNGGQILLSNATRELIEDELSDDVELLDLGENRLKDLDRPERIFQVLHPGVASSFPPLRTVDALIVRITAREIPSRRSHEGRRGDRRDLLTGARVRLGMPVAVRAIARWRSRRVEGRHISVLSLTAAVSA